MDQGPLVIQQINAAKKLVDEFNTYAPLQAAYWLKDAEQGNWFLYLASDQIDDTNFDLAYGEVLRIAAEIQDPWFDPFQVKVVGMDNRQARAVVELQKNHPMNLPMRYLSQPLGDQIASEVYIYATPSPAAP